MRRTRVAITLDEPDRIALDRLVAQRGFPSRSQAVRSALADQQARLAEARLARACAALNPAEEKALAEEGMREDAAAWPAY